VRAVLLDTHAWAWSLTRDARLSNRATTAINEAETVLVSPISFFEIGQKVRIGKWPEMERFVRRLPELLEQQGGAAAGLDPQVCVEAAIMNWPHRDPFDRLIAATANRYRLPLVSADAAFDAVATRVW
jgi:PIN domain nuclease of toxin-antitoxin system